MLSAQVSTNAGMFVVHKDGRLTEMVEQPYDSEKLLQALLSQYPSLLAGNQIDPGTPRRWLLVSREYGVPDALNGGERWSLDHLFLDQEAIPTLVEVKRSSDTRIRREVVGQMLDYASNAVMYWPIESMKAKFEQRCISEGKNPDELVVELVGDHQTVDAFWDMVKANLRQGKIRLLFVADVIPQELRRIIEFLNGQMNPAEVLAVEIRQFIGEGLQTLVPRVMGQTMEAEQKKGKSVPAREWDETSFFAELESRKGHLAASVARKILAWAQPRMTRMSWGRGIQNGSLVPIVSHKDIDYQLFAIYTYGSLEIYFEHYRNKPAFASPERREELLKRLNAIEGIRLPADRLERRPSIQLDVLGNEEALKGFLSTYEWFLAQVVKS